MAIRGLPLQLSLFLTSMPRRSQDIDLPAKSAVPPDEARGRAWAWRLYWRLARSRPMGSPR